MYKVVIFQVGLEVKLKSDQDAWKGIAYHFRLVFCDTLTLFWQNEK